MDMHIPSELIEEIMLKLPLKYIVRFRILSQQYFSFLTDTQFIKSHYDLSATSSNSLLYMTRFNKFRWVEIDESINCHHEVHLPVPYHEGLAMVNSCRGFVLLMSSPKYYPLTQYFSLWNPLTGAYKEVVYFPNPSLKFYGSRPQYFLLGLGYDESNDDYLVVVGRTPIDYFGKFAFLLEFFSIRTNSWKQITINHLPYLILDECKGGVFFNGSIHWLVTTKDDKVNDYVISKVIIAFNLAKKSVSEIPLPDLHRGYFEELKVVQECLSVSSWKDYKTKIWIMKEYGLPSSWTECFTVVHFRLLEPICFTKDGDLVAKEGMKYLVKFNDEGTLIQREQFDHSKLGFELHPRQVLFTPTLLSLPSEDDHE